MFAIFALSTCAVLPLSFCPARRSAFKLSLMMSAWGTGIHSSGFKDFLLKPVRLLTVKSTKSTQSMRCTHRTACACGYRIFDMSLCVLPPFLTTFSLVLHFATHPSRVTQHSFGSEKLWSIYLCVQKLPGLAVWFGFALCNMLID